MQSENAKKKNKIQVQKKCKQKCQKKNGNATEKMHKNANKMQKIKKCAQNTGKKGANK